MKNDLHGPLTQTKGSSFLKACFNTTNAFLGLGLLTAPYALSTGGWLSLVPFFIVAAITFYTTILIKKCLDKNPSIRSYQQIAERAFGKRGQTFVSIVMNTELYLAGIGLLILEADNLHKLFPKFLINIGSLNIPGIQSFIILTALVIFPSMMLTDLGILSYVSATGVFSCVIIFVSILCVGIFNDVGFKAKGKLLKISGIPTSVSLYIVCFAGHPVIPAIYSSMQKSNQFNKVLLTSFSITTITYLWTAIVGYLMYGKNVESQITLNLPTGKISANVAIYTTLLIPITRYALMLTPVANGIETNLSVKYRNSRCVQLSIRIALLISTVVLACAFPHFENLMSIVGSIFVVFASILLPCLFHLKISNSYQSWSYKMVCIVGIIVFGIVAGIVGTYSSIAELVNKK